MDQPPIFIQYDCTEAERRQGLQLLGPPTKRNTTQKDPARGLTGWVLFVAVAALLFVWLKYSSPARPMEATPTSGESFSGPARVALGASAVGAGLWVASLAVLIASQRARARGWTGSLTFFFDEQGLTSARLGRRDTYGWSKFLGFEEGPDVFVIRSSPTAGDIFPKRLFSDQDLSRVRGILQRNLTRAAIPVALGFEVTRP